MKKGVSMFGFVKKSVLGAALGLALCLGSAPSAMFSAEATIITAQSGETRVVGLGMSKSLIVELPRDTADILVSDPKIADAVLRSPRRVYVTGIAVGATDIFFFDGAGRQILALDLMVGQDTAGLNRLMHKHVRGTNLKAETVNDKLVVTGSVASPSEARKVQDIAGPFAGGVENVINLVTIDGEDQVYVQVTVAEVRREVARQLGAVAQYAFDVGNAALTATSAPNNLINTSILSPTGIAASFNGGGIDFNFLEETSALKVLAQPTLTAVSGEEAKFLAGGEFPVPVSRDEDGNIIVTYKQFGVALNMVPIVHSEGRITLKIGTEVSELSGENAFTSSSGFTLPSILTRRTNTTVEMPSGGSIVLGGLIKEETRMGISGVPGAKDIPILGTLFRSNDFKSSRTELMIIVTPYIVKPVDANKLASPADNMAPAISAENFFLGRLTQVYGVKNGRSSGNFHGNVGFVIE